MCCGLNQNPDFVWPQHNVPCLCLPGTRKKKKGKGLYDPPSQQESCRVWQHPKNYLPRLCGITALPHRSILMSSEHVPIPVFHPI
jgi:hypothetical protein